jgi:hypothetical protein
MSFDKYIHLERYGTDAVDGLDVGTCYIFPKLDGTNASIWLDGGEMQCGSRNRHLTKEADNAGFMNWITTQEKYIKLCKENPDLRFYGEWLVPHSIKSYREDAWRTFYIFDVVKDGKFVHYDEYSVLLDKYGVEYIPCILKVTNPSYDILVKTTQENKYLLEENSGFGEGVVIKRYDYQNKFGNTVWAKLITNTFKEKHIKEMGANVVSLKMIEEEIADKYITKHLVDKVYDKISVSSGFSQRSIPALLGMVYHDLITEELWQIIKEFNYPKIDFKTLNHCVINKVKLIRTDIFSK